MIILVESVTSIDIVPQAMDINITGIVALSLNIFKKIKIGIIFCHVINHPTPPILKYFPTFTSQKCIGAIPIFRMMEIRISSPPISVVNSFLIMLMDVMYISRRIEATV